MDPSRSNTTDDRLSNALVGVGIGIGFLVVYLAAGLLFAQWSIDAFLEYLAVEIVLWLLAASLFVIAVVAIPVFLFRQYRLVSPVSLLALVLLGWLTAGLFTGAVFGLSLYVFGLAPLYLVLYGLLGGGELSLRNRASGGGTATEARE